MGCIALESPSCVWRINTIGFSKKGEPSFYSSGLEGQRVAVFALLEARTLTQHQLSSVFYIRIRYLTHTVSLAMKNLDLFLWQDLVCGSNCPGL